MARWTATADRLTVGTPIIRGFDWGGGDGYGFTADEDITGYTFNLVLKNG